MGIENLEGILFLVGIGLTAGLIFFLFRNFKSAPIDSASGDAPASSEPAVETPVVRTPTDEASVVRMPVTEASSVDMSAPNEMVSPELGAEKTPAAQTPPVAVTATAEDDWSPSKSLGEALTNTEKSIWGRIKGLFSTETSKADVEMIEEILYTSDLGNRTVQMLMEGINDLGRKERSDFDSIKKHLRKSFNDIFAAKVVDDIATPNANSKKPKVIMIVGVNGAGKTTSIGKLASHLSKDGKKVLVAAGDTFRAAAGNQLKVWTERAGVEIFSPEGVSDPSAVAYEAVSKAKSREFDFVLVDTAGRLHTSAPLMEELKKMKRVLTKVIDDAPHEVLIVLDANSGQNALIQAQQFHAALGLTGVILTKLDGTSKGGVAAAIVLELGVPIKWIGVGEKLGDLRRFDSQSYVDSILPP